MIRQLTRPAEFLPIESLQREIWGMFDRDVVAAHTLVAWHKAGGLILGVFDGERMIGFLTSFLGRVEGEWVVWSDMMGFLPEYRGRGLGYQTKLQQRDYALSIGIDKVVWTYDPLQPANARLNLGRLGGRVRRYIEDCYGLLEGHLTGTLPTDRFLVEWELQSPRTLALLEGTASPWPAAPHVVNPHGLNAPWSLGNGGAVKVLTPGEPSLEWRLHTREVFQALLSRGYAVVDYDLSDRKSPGYLCMPA